MKETNILRLTLITLTKVGRYFRNHVGLIKAADGTVHKFGLTVGSSDIIGFTPITINGKRIAVFTAIEVKSATGKPSKEQDNFIKMVKDNGGIAGIVRSPEESLALIGEYLDKVHK